MKLFHGSPFLFSQFDLTGAGKGTGIKFGFGVYLTESEASAVHYSQPRGMDLMSQHFLYEVEIPDLTVDNHLVSANPVPQSIVSRVEKELGVVAPEGVKSAGKEFRKWIGMTLTGSKTVALEEERRAGELLDGVGVICNVWPQAQTKPEGLKNIVMFNASRVKIIKVEEIEIELKSKKWVLINRKEI